MPTKPSIQDQAYLFKATLNEITQDEAEALLEANSGKVLSDVRNKLDNQVGIDDVAESLNEDCILGQSTVRFSR